MNKKYFFLLAIVYIASIRCKKRQADVPTLPPLVAPAQNELGGPVDTARQEEAALLARVQAEEAARRAQAMAAEAARVAALADQRQAQDNPGPYRRLFQS